MEIVGRGTPSLMWNAWNKDPTKAALLRALVSCQVRLGHDRYFSWDMCDALAQQEVCFYLSIFIERGGSTLLNSFQVLLPHSDALLFLSRFYIALKSPVGNENQ